MQLCGSAHSQGCSRDFAPCSQPLALFVLLPSVGLLHVTDFTTSSGSESLCASAGLGTFYAQQQAVAFSSLLFMCALDLCFC